MVVVFVAGATGKQGGATARALLKDGHTVHAYVRNVNSDAAQALKNQGAHLFEGDWEDRNALKVAIKGTAAVFFPSMPSFTDPDAETRWATNIVSEARQAGTVQHLVYSTVAGIDRYDMTPDWDRNPFLANYYISKSRGEQLVRTAGFKSYTILRPSEFMANFLLPFASFQVPDLIKDGTWHTSFPLDYELDLIDPEDVGKVAVKVILDPEKFAGRELEVTGESLPISEVFALLSEESGKVLKVHTYELEEAKRIAIQDPLEQGRLGRLDRREAKLESKKLENFEITFRGFKDFLRANHDVVVETYQNVP